MKRHFLLLFLFTACAFGQWNIEISFIPLHATPVTNTDIVSPKTKSNYLISLNASYDLNERFIIESGFSFSSKTVIWAEDIPDTDPVWNNTGGSRPDYHGIQFIRWVEQFHSVMLPILIQYKFPLGESSTFLVGGGIQPGYLFKRLNELHSTTGRINTWESDNGRVIGGAIFSIKYHAVITNSVWLSLHSRYSYDVYPNENNLELRFHSLGLGAGILFKLY